METIRQPASLILASSSPRREQLLTAMGLSFIVAIPHVDESVGAYEAPKDVARRLCIAKAQAVAASYAEGLIIAADTLVTLDGEILDKPIDAKDATDMLTRLRNRQHEVHTGLAVLDATTHRLRHQVVTTIVRMRNYKDDEIGRYVTDGDPFDKAGGYAIQHDAFQPVASIRGCYTNVVGLPVCRLFIFLRDWKVKVPIPPPSQCLTSDVLCSWPRNSAQGLL
jgi:MAF protein